MVIWSPDNIRHQCNLYLSNEEKAAIQAKFPRAEDRKIYADAVFEGGGVKGTAFLGALQCFSEVGIQWRKVAGTSAGAITAALVATGLTIAELEAIIGKLDYMCDILSQKKPFIFNGSPEDDLRDPKWMIGNLIMARQKGQYSSEPFKQWLSKTLDGHLQTFAPFLNGLGNAPEWYNQRQLRIIVSDISEGEMCILPDDLPKYNQQPEHFSVAEAVRLSMSIPFFFEPGELNGHTIVDGGILSNFPLWVYDASQDRAPRCPTFGFQLTNEKRNPRPIQGAAEILSSMFDTMMVAHDRRHQREHDQGRIIGIDTSKVSVTKFNLNDKDKDYLYRQGYESARTFLLDKWDWQKHLESRGYPALELQSVG